MNYKITNDSDAWKFLIETVYNNNQGEFRIHTNKDGIRLYIRFENKQFTGEIYQYHVSINNLYHNSLRRIYEGAYVKTLVGKSLTDVLNKHFLLMPGDVLFEDDWVKKYCADVTSEMTVEEFIECDLNGRNQLDRLDETLLQLKQIYNF
jgi:hypothetical protein